MSRGVRAGLAVVLALVVTAPAPALGSGSPSGGSSAGDRKAAVDQERSRLQHEFENLTAAEAAVLARYEVSQQATQALDAELATLSTSLAETTAAIDMTRQRISAAAQRSADLEKRASEAGEALIESRDRLTRQALAAYLHHGRFDVIETALDPERTAVDVQVASHYAERAGEVQRQNIADWVADRDSL
ncbi:MAG TPA: hypothetical protein VF855_08980, partial [Acidimicrobiales bacterium]